VFINTLLCAVKVDRMSERKNTLVCCFYSRNPLISAYDIHECIHVTMRLREDEVAMVQIDGSKRRVYIKLL
jgi:hypothetical protein